MQLCSWLHKRMTGRPQTRRSSASKPTLRFRPQFEALEGRDVPSTLTVTNNLDSGAGSLRAELALANNQDTIVFAPGLAGQTINLTTGELLIQKNLTIAGPGAGQLALSGGSAARVFEVGSKEQVTLSGLTICNGHAGFLGNLYSYDGGGILNLGTLTVSGCILSGNSAGDAPYYANTHGKGGGIYNAGTLTVSSTTLSGNQAGVYGGGIYNAATATITACTFSSPGSGFSISNPKTRQSAYDGGAIFNARTLTVDSCSFSFNFAAYGGAIYNNGSLKVSNSAFSGNIATIGYGSNNISGLYTDGGGNSFA